jgi:hypothetical protein
MKKKANPHQQRRVLDQIARNIEERRRQMTDLEDALRQHRYSAERCISAMCRLLPDRADEQSETDGGSRVDTVITPMLSNSDVDASSVRRPSNVSVDNNANIVTSCESPPGKRHPKLSAVDDDDNADDGHYNNAAAAAAATAAEPRRSTNVEGGAVDPPTRTVTGDSKHVGRKRWRQQPSTASCSNISKKRSAVARNFAGGNDHLQVAGNSVTLSSFQLASAIGKQPGGGDNGGDVELQTAGGQSTGNILTQVAQRTSGGKRLVTIDRRQRNDDENIEKFRDTQMTKNTSRNPDNGDSISSRAPQGVDDDDEDEEDGGSDEESSDDEDDTEDERSKRVSPRPMVSKSRDRMTETNHGRAATNTQQRPSQKSTCNGTTSETTSGPSLNRLPTATVSLNVADRGPGNLQLQTSRMQASSIAVLNSKQSKASASSPDGGVPSGDCFGNKAKPTTSRQPMQTSRIELSF